MSAVINLLGRVLLSLIFIFSGLSKIVNFSGTSEMIAQKGLPFSPFFLFLAILFEVVGGVCLLTGYKGRIGALLLAVFLVPATLLFHFAAAFDSTGALTNQGEMIQVMKNLAILGGLLMVFSNGTGALSVGKDN
ncbi:MAG: DoxX family protein [Bacteriovoracia bacterium]